VTWCYLELPRLCYQLNLTWLLGCDLTRCCFYLTCLCLTTYLVLPCFYLEAVDWSWPGYFLTWLTWLWLVLLTYLDLGFFLTTTPSWLVTAYLICLVVTANWLPLSCVVLWLSQVPPLLPLLLVTYLDLLSFWLTLLGLTWEWHFCDLTCCYLGITFSAANLLWPSYLLTCVTCNLLLPWSYLVTGSESYFVLCVACNWFHPVFTYTNCLNLSDCVVAVTSDLRVSCVLLGCEFDLAGLHY